jgi:pimeloyl-ACP methyl ester carboxylesterase
VRPPVVLVHGLTRSTGWWRPTVAALEPDYEVHVVRLPGVPHGDAAEWFGAWLLAEGLAGATVVGHSMGGTVSVLTAAQNPAAVGRLVLIAPAGIVANRSRRSYLIPALRAGSGSIGRLVLASRDVLRFGPIRLLRVASDLLQADIAPVLSSVRAPTLVIWGAEDRLLPPSLGAVFCAEIPDCRLVTLERCAHVPMLEAPNELNAALRSFLQEAPAASSLP